MVQPQLRVRPPLCALLAIRLQDPRPARGVALSAHGCLECRTIRPVRHKRHDAHYLIARGPWRPRAGHVDLADPTYLADRRVIAATAAAPTSAPQSPMARLLRESMGGRALLHVEGSVGLRTFSTAFSAKTGSTNDEACTAGE